MKKTQWIIIGASSVIAEKFAHIAAQNNCSLLLIGRNKEQLKILSSDIYLRFKTECDIMTTDLSSDISELLTYLKILKNDCHLFLAQSETVINTELTLPSINSLLNTNVVNMSQIIHTYISRAQKNKKILFLSSVAAARGRMKNSLYGGSKAAIELYLQGLQQSESTQINITIARLGFIDTQQTHGLSGIFYAAAPEKCAMACWKALEKNKRFIYFPRFWRTIIMIIKLLPFPLLKLIKN